MRIACVKPEPDGGAIITPVEPYCSPFKVSADYVAEHNPKAGDTYIPQSLSRKERGYSVEPPKPLTPEQQHACKLIAQGLIELFFSHLPVREEFPSELDAEEVGYDDLN